MDFTDRAVLVTGASRGIGRAIALQFAGRGARVAVHYRAGRAAAEATRAALPGGPHPLVQADVGDADAVRRMVDEAADGLGRLDVLVNNAGIYEAHPPTDSSYAAWRAAWRRTLETNLLGAANAAWCAARRMIRQGGGGRIVNVSSRGAFRGEPEAPAYGASKAGLNAMSQSLALALAPHGIFVGAVAPGFVTTERVAPRLEGAEGERIRRQSPLGRVATPDEVAYAVAFLASDGAEFTTGTIIDVNGASYLRS